MKITLHLEVDAALTVLAILEGVMENAHLMLPEDPQSYSDMARSSNAFLEAVVEAMPEEVLRKIEKR